MIIHVEIESYTKAKKTKGALGEYKMLKKLHSREKPRRFISGQSVSGSGSLSTELGHLDRVGGLRSSGPESETLVINSFERFLSGFTICCVGGAKLMLTILYGR